MSVIWKKLSDRAAGLKWKNIILGDPLLNNRIIAFTGLERYSDRSLLDFATFEIAVPASQINFIYLDTGFEIIFCQWDGLIFSLEVIKLLRDKIPPGRMITLHEPFASAWEDGNRERGVLMQANLTTYLYKLDRRNFNSIDSSINCSIRTCLAYNKAIAASLAGFFKEAMKKKPSRREMESCFKKNDFYGLFEGEKLVSIAAITRKIPKARCISYVFTDPLYRGKGYAAILVAALCRQIFKDQAYDSIFLYADVENPISNRVYQHLGFIIYRKCKTYTFEQYLNNKFS